MKKQVIYLDYASSTPIDESVQRAMSECAARFYVNPSSIHTPGVEVRQMLENARGKVAAILGAEPTEIIFTGSGTESNNLALRGLIENCLHTDTTNVGHPKKIKNLIPHIVTTNIEHSSVLETCKYLERSGQAKVTYVPVEPNGLVDPIKVKDALRENTVLVSIMYANNEIGTIQPISEISKVIRNFRNRQVPITNSQFQNKFKFLNLKLKTPFFHTDAVQAANYLSLNVQKLGVDLMTLNGSKIYGPKGVGLLYKKSEIEIEPIMWGGDQEWGLRPGTENLAAIVGFSKALEITEKIKEKESLRLMKLRNYFISQIKKLSNSNVLQNYRISINGDLKERLPNNVNISVPGIESELLVLELDARGIAVSSKSACQSDEAFESYVIKAIHSGQPASSIRFSLGRQTTKNDVKYTVKALKEIIEKYSKIKKLVNSN